MGGANSLNRQGKGLPLTVYSRVPFVLKLRSWVTGLKNILGFRHFEPLHPCRARKVA